MENAVAGRKNRFFSAPGPVADVIVTAFTVPEILKVNEPDPQACLNRLLTGLSERFADDPGADAENQL